MKKVFKIFFAFLFIGCSGIFTLIYIMSNNLADSYKVSRGEELRIDGLVPVTAVYNGAKMSQGVYTRPLEENFKVELKLFGVIPFSTVDVEIVDDMYVEVLGEPFGMKVYTDGVMVVESSDIVTKKGEVNPAKEAGIKEGDYIKTVNGQVITCNEDLLQLVTQSQGDTMKFEVEREGKTFYCKVAPVLDNESGVYRIGIWVRDSSAGVGTLTFYSPTTNVVCGLGHGICDSDTGILLDVYEGELVEAEVVSVQKGSAGSPGALKGKLTYNSIAEISLNCEQGVYGFISNEMECETLTEIALKQEVHDGEAQILCTVNGNTPKLYSCKIEKVSADDAKTQNLIVTVTDKELINNTGGIVQGMSGSPILQDGKLVGALTHVLVDDSKTGYGIYAENMLDTARSVAEKELKKAS